MTVVYLHAFPFDPRMFAPLPEGAEAPLLYELGETMDDWADAILDRYDGPLTLVGASMGGYVAYHVARLAPERVHGLFTEGARAQPDTPAGRARRNELIRVVREDGLGALWVALRPLAFSHHAGDELLARARGWALDRDPDEAVRALTAMRDRHDTTDVLKLLDPHPHVLLGELDRLARAGDFNGVVLEEHIRIVREAGHLPSLERPETVRPLIEEFLEWTSRPTS
jgi:pimeloyl-ACP methyl ester carboxylesterase